MSVFTQIKMFSENDFYSTFVEDVRKARGRVLIHSPYLHLNRIRFLSSDLSNLVHKGVVVCVYAREPHGWETRLESVVSECAETELCVRQLESLGVHVTLRPHMHEKLAIIDEKVFWHGSLNILSHYRSTEQMTRSVDLSVITRAIAQYKSLECSGCATLPDPCGAVIMDRQQLTKMQVLGEHFANRRRFLGLSQRDLAALCGIEQPRLSKFENGQQNLTTASLLRLAEHLGLEQVFVPRVHVPFLRRLNRRPGE